MPARQLGGDDARDLPVALLKSERRAVIASLWHWQLAAGLGGFIAIYTVGFILFRTSGERRPAWKRLLHPSGGQLQEEYGGTKPEDEARARGEHLPDDLPSGDSDK